MDVLWPVRMRGGGGGVTVICCPGCGSPFVPEAAEQPASMCRFFVLGFFLFVAHDAQCCRAVTLSGALCYRCVKCRIEHCKIGAILQATQQQQQQETMVIKGFPCSSLSLVTPASFVFLAIKRVPLSHFVSAGR